MRYGHTGKSTFYRANEMQVLPFAGTSREISASFVSVDATEQNKLASATELIIQCGDRIAVRPGKLGKQPCVGLDQSALGSDFLRFNELAPLLGIALQRAGEILR